MPIVFVATSLSLNVVGWLLSVHVMVGTGTPVKVQEIFKLPPLRTVSVWFCPAPRLVVGDSTSNQTNNLLKLS